MSARSCCRCADVLIDIEALRAFVAAVFRKGGCSATEAADIAHSLSGANLAGHDSHGVVRVPRYVEYLLDGRVVANQTIATITDTTAFALVDGRYGFGQSIGRQAVKLGIAKAAEQGVAIVGLRNSGHLGRIGEWAETAAAAGQVSVHFVNVPGSSLVAPFGGVEKRFSTAPVAIGVPQPDAPPVILDFSTARVAEGKVLVAFKGGKPVPDDALILPDGRLTADPAALYGDVPPGTSPDPRKGPGALRAMGDHKGSGLALMCELLAGALTGAGCSGIGDRRLCNGMLSIYLSVAAFDHGGGFADEVRQFVDYIRSTKPATPGGEVLMPGDPERRMAAKREKEGIPLPEDTWQSLLDAARLVKLEAAALAAAEGAARR